MAEQNPPDIPPPPSRRRRRRGRLGFWMVIGPVALICGLGIAFLSLTGRPLVLPHWAADQVARAIEARAAGVGVSVGEVVVEVGREGRARVLLRNLELDSPDGASLGQFNAVSARFAPGALVEGDLRATTVSITGAQFTIRRSADGAFGIGFGGGTSAEGDLASLLDRIDTAFSAEGLAGIARISAEDLTITLEDARSGRIWQVTGGKIDIKNGAESVEIAVDAEVFNGTENLARVQLTFDAEKGSHKATLAASIKEAQASDIALQSPALAFLGALDARVSGTFRTVIAEDGALERLDGSLDIGSGALHPTDAAVPVPFNSARTSFSYDPDNQKIAFSEISVESATLRMSGRGQAYLADFRGAWPDALLAQVAFDHLEAAPEGVFADAVGFDRAIADFRVRLDPFQVDFGQVVLTDGAMRVSGKGTFGVGEGGWQGSVDVTAPVLLPDRLLALWPLRLAPNTRRWLSENVLGGTLHDVVVAVRLRPATRPRLGLTFDYEDAEVRFMPEMPAVAGASGHAALQDAAFTITVADGTVSEPGHGPVAVGGSDFQVENVFEEPGRAILRLATRSRLDALLAALDNPPFEVLKKSNRPADMVDAEADLRADVRFPLGKRVAKDEVNYMVTGALTGATSDTIVPGRRLEADRLSVDVVPGTLSLAGPVTLDGLPLDVAVDLPLDAGPDAPPGRVEGSIELSQRFLDTFHIDLPPGTVGGQGTGLVALVLPKSAPPDFTLTSELQGVTLQIPALGWSKPADTAGKLELSGTLGPVPEISRLSLAGPGLQAVGNVNLGAGGKFVSADFSRVAAGNWLDAPVRIIGEGAGKPPRIVLDGGSVDITRRPDGAGGGETVPLTVRLDALKVTDTIVLTGFAGEIVAGRGLNGQYQARVNGGAPVSGVLVPQRGRTAIQLRGEDAGRILREAGLFKSLEQGSLDLILTPRKDGVPGFDGQLVIEQAILGDQPVLVGMLDAVSVVGLIDQLRGPGVLFDRIEGLFRLTGDRLTLTRGSAVGASLGMSLDGIYDIAGKRLDMQGVISPIYLLNGVGQIFTRRGEGLFGFTFKLRGPAEDPKVSVNPLSILTPGMFRELFRRAPPE